eukprot:TRINITY_DN9550_c0_g1_i5.p1 TRINITY_DN9550_c0_g1~~TRINITY_DN9550_c0_g1_i5.p1  ORF type:complete len:103 (+),score=1.50 TRINITY_DN9550_c0_g1_i5:74-382(+)
MQDPNSHNITEMCRKDTCADCSQPTALWASVNLGVFICLECSGVHRGLGTHVSQVKSVTLDDWTTEEIQKMKGNAQVNSTLEKYLSANVKPNQHTPPYVLMF